MVVYIARADGGLDWLPEAPAGEDYGYAAHRASVDTLVLGRTTFETVLSFGVAWPYAGLRVVVLSHGAPRVPDGLDVAVMAGEPAELVRALGETGSRRVWVDGDETVQRFLRAGLVSELIVTRVPVLLGDGVPLFGPLDGDVARAHVETQAYPDGMVQSRYRPAG